MPEETIKKDVPINQKFTVRSLRVRLRYTQTEAAELLGISEPTLRKWEVDSGDCTYNEQQKIEQVYGVPCDFIYFGSEFAFSELLKESIKSSHLVGG